MNVQPRILIALSEKPLSIEAALQWVQRSENGATSLFIGTVRATNLGRDVQQVHYSLFAPLAKLTLQSICEDVANTFDCPLSLYISHFHGMLPVGGTSVVIAAGAPHRAEAFSASRALLESLKKRAPIWKQEHYTDGLSEWVKGHALCQHNHTHDVS